VFVSPELDDYHLQIFGMLDIPGNAVPNASFKARIGIDQALFYPVEVKKGSIQSKSVNGRELNLDIVVMDANIENSESVVGEIIGSTLLGDVSKTDIVWKSFEWITPVDLPAPNLINGSLEIEICRKGQDRLIKIGKSAGIAVIPNPADNQIKVKVDALEVGWYSLDLVDVQGSVMIKNSWAVVKDGKRDFDFDMKTSDLSSGMYFLIYKTPTESHAQPVFIIH
jgi:hypothetical protein